MKVGLAVRGFVLGFAVAAPVGPIGVLVIRRTLALGPRTGFVSGLGAATADAAYGSFAALGLTSATRLLVGHAGLLRLAGGLFLCLWNAYGSTLLLTVTNPMTILSFAAAFAGLGLVDGVMGPGAGLALVAAVFLGSLLWWGLLSGAVGLVRGKLGDGALRVVNWIAGAVLIGFGATALAGART
jgi:threonine/homoserine/homoserine lactone efflux protein